jgi:hypothetical protein
VTPDAFMLDVAGADGASKAIIEQMSGFSYRLRPGTTGRSVRVVSGTLWAACAHPAVPQGRG